MMYYKLFGKNKKRKKKGGTLGYIKTEKNKVFEIPTK